MPKKSDNRISKWSGATVVCIASGPSLTMEDVDSVRIAHCSGKTKVIAVNREYVTAPWADVCYAADHTFWDVYMKEGLRDVFKGELWTMSGIANKKHGINCIGKFGGTGYSIIPHCISTGGNSGYQAIHLAAYWGATKIVLLGYDMQRTDRKEHHYGKHLGDLRNGRNFPFWIKRMKPLIRDLKSMGVQVLNATRVTAIPSKLIPRARIGEVAW